MVRELEKVQQTSQFPETAPAANPVFFRTYSRRTEKGRETWDEVCDRTLQGLTKLGKLTPAEAAILDRMQRQIKALSSGRWLWVGGVEWIEQQENFSGAYNCSSTNICDWRAFGLLMDLAMMGCGTGAVLEPHYINQLPAIRNYLKVSLQGEIGTIPINQRQEETEVTIVGNEVTIYVGDSRRGWVKSYQTLLELSTDERFTGEVKVIIDLSNVRPAGERLKGFGGVANPIKLPDLYLRCAAILNKALGRQLNSVECCLLIDEAAVVVVAGNVRRSAGMRQGNSEDELFANAKSNLWQQDENGNWRIDPERDALRMANHSRVFHHKPTLEETIAAVRTQYYSGEGAIQWAGEAVARANCDLLKTPELKVDFLQAYDRGKAKEWIEENYPNISPNELEHRLARLGLNPCVTADTWVHTEYGARQVKDLIGVQQAVYVNGELFSTTPEGFFFTGVKPVVKVQTKEGYSLRLTKNHQVLKVTAQTQKKQYSEWCEVSNLKIGDRILIHNHRNLQPWEGVGSFDQGWLLGNFLGDGCFSVNQINHTYQAKLRYWGNTQVEMKEYALSLVNNLPKPPQYSQNLQGIYHPKNKYYEISSSSLADLAQTFGLQHHFK
ncbi:MAG: ribonucleoside-triphosphate reductase, adenosylcobalamin-dependent, partial [Phormidium sp.]